MNCYSCIHSKTCFMRIQTARTIQSFKLLAEDSVEAKNMSRKKSVGDLWQVLADACTAFKADITDIETTPPNPKEIRQVITFNERVTDDSRWITSAELDAYEDSEFQPYAID